MAGQTSAVCTHERSLALNEESSSLQRDASIPLQGPQMCSTASLFPDAGTEPELGKALSTHCLETRPLKGVASRAAKNSGSRIPTGFSNLSQGTQAVIRPRQLSEQSTAGLLASQGVQKSAMLCLKPAQQQISSLHSPAHREPGEEMGREDPSLPAPLMLHTHGKAFTRD